MFTCGPALFGSAPSSGYAYWRVYVTAVVNSDAVAVQEIEMRATSGGADQCVGGTAFASTTQGSFPLNGAGAFNGDFTHPSKGWESEVLPASVGYAFAAPVEVAELVIWASTSSTGSSQGPVDFILERSADGGITWTTKKQFTGITGWVYGDSKTFAVDA